MQFKLARAKRTPKTVLDEREHNWKRAIAILGMRRIKPIDVWWCRRFLEGIVSNPLVYVPRKDNYLDQGPFARKLRDELNSRFPK